MVTKRHTHKFRRHVYDSGYTIFFCTLPDCTYKVKRELTLGKMNICWRCGKEFEMNEYSLRLAKPHCPDCQMEKGTGQIRKIKVTPPIKEADNEINELRKKLLSLSNSHSNIDDVL